MVQKPGGVYKCSELEGGSSMGVELSKLLYIFSLSLQMAGALILLEFLFHKCSKKKILYEIMENAPGYDGGEFTTSGTINILKKEEIRKYAAIKYKNIIAAIYISIGYLLSVFSDISANRIVICLCILVTAIFFLVIGNLLAKLLAKCIFNDDYTVTQENDEEIDYKQ